MIKIEIIVEKSAVFDIVALNSAYGDASASDKTDRIITLQSDDGLLSGFWRERCGMVTEKLRGFITASTLSADRMNLTLELSSAYDEALTDSMKEDLFKSITSGVTAAWFRFTLRDRAEEWERQSAELLDRAFSKLCHRKKPLRIKPENV